MMRTRIVTVVLCTLVLLIAPGWSSVPVHINIQGRLTDATGEPLPAGIKGCNFAIFDAETGGTQIWPAGGTEAHLIYTGDDGLWQATLGSVVPLPYTAFADTSRWLEVTMDDGANPPEVFGRIQIGSLPYAYRAQDAQLAQLADSASTVADLCVNENKLADLCVTSGKLADAAVTGLKIAPDAVTSDKIQNGSIQFPDVASNGATTGDVMMWNGSQWVAQDPIPPGVILMWSGALSEIPVGWALCDGAGNRPNLTDRFILATSQGEEPSPAKIGGTSQHSHVVDVPLTEASTPYGGDGQWQGVQLGTFYHAAIWNHIHAVNPTPTTSTTTPHLPPYYKLAFIIKL